VEPVRKPKARSTQRREFLMKVLPYLSFSTYEGLIISRFLDGVSTAVSSRLLRWLTSLARQHLGLYNRFPGSSLLREMLRSSRRRLSRRQAARLFVCCAVALPSLSTLCPPFMALPTHTEAFIVPRYNGVSALGAFRFL
jgi:hypothetical protein